MSKTRGEQTSFDTSSPSHRGQILSENICSKKKEQRDSIPLLNRSITCFTLTRQMSEITIDIENEVYELDCIIDHYDWSYQRQSRDFVKFCDVNVSINYYDDTDENLIRHSSFSSKSASNSIKITSSIADNFRQVRPIMKNDVSPKIPMRRASLIVHVKNN
jgi:hypothetical protein